jgi:hypothetical protein
MYTTFMPGAMGLGGGCEKSRIIRLVVKNRDSRYGPKGDNPCVGAAVVVFVVDCDNAMPCEDPPVPLPSEETEDESSSLSLLLS